MDLCNLDLSSTDVSQSHKRQVLCNFRGYLMGKWTHRSEPFILFVCVIHMCLHNYRVLFEISVSQETLYISG